MHCTTNHTHHVRQERRKELLEGADIDSAHTNETVILVSATTNKQETLLNVLIYTYKTITAKKINVFSTQVLFILSEDAAVIHNEVICSFCLGY